MGVALSSGWTQERFLSWAGEQRERYEFDGVQPVAMTGGNAAHALLTQSLYAALRARLRGSAWRLLGPDAGIATLGAAVRYPDALVTGAKFAMSDRLIPGAVVVFEVLSPRSGRVDRIEKVREYAAVPTIRRYVMLETSGVGATVLSRETARETWRATVLAEGDTLHLPEIGIELPISELYEDLDLTG